MDLPLYTDSESEEPAIEDDTDIDDAAFDNPRCGICMDVVIDRGVLDCCQDWFCFACIDNWATITNLCPFCKNEFQLITCLPVYDTVGRIDSEDHSFSRDDEWLIQGKNNTLSFPSYYINEEAVVCLDGDGCKIRSGFTTSEDELSVDTSIACDSCDIWYHAFCVSFNSSCTSDSSWLCPRCVSKQGAQKPDTFIMQNVVTQSEPRSVDLGWSVDYNFAGKVSVSVADTGDTDIVVSMVEEKPRALASGNLSLTDCLDVDRSKSIAINMTNTADGSDNVEIGFQADKSGCDELVPFSIHCIDQTMSDTIAFRNNSEIVLDVSSKAASGPADNLKDEFPVVPSIHDALLDMKPSDHKLESTIVSSASQNPSSTSFNPKRCGFLGPKILEEKCKLDNTIDICKIPNPCSTETDNDLSLNISVDNVHPDSSVASSTSVDIAKDDVLSGIGEDAYRLMPQHNFEDGSLAEEDMMKTLPDAIDADFLRIPDTKRAREMEEKIEIEHPMKKSRSDGKHQMLLLEKEVHKFALDFTKKDLSPTTVKDGALKHTPGKDGKALDIMSLVQENKHRASDVSSYTDCTEKLMQKRDGAAGLRVKKIMRSVGDNKESSMLIQKLREEIREAVQDKTPNIIDKVKILNGELLTAFRAALARPQNEVVDKTGLSHVAVRKPFLQKGKTRENLTKKIYQTSTGRRKKAWDRDCEVEFWKRRCMIAKPQKVETLQSVLELLRKASSSSLEDSEIDQDPHKQTTDSILSRVYLADASVFPRKDDIKPLSVLEGYQGIDSHNQESSISGKGSQHVCATNMTNNGIGISDCHLHGKVPSTDKGEKKLSAPNPKKEAPSQKGKSNGTREAPTTIVDSSSSKESALNSNEASRQSCVAKTDKKKWALEVLARKNASFNADASKGNQEDRSPLKGNHPLLTQLPADMMPLPAPSRFNKVPLSVRQAQLNRIAEHYLRRANLSQMRRTAVTELAVADAVNVEKDIVERSNSKLVYVNLCSQVLCQRKTKPQTSENISRGPIATSTHDTDFRVEVMFSNSVLTEGVKVEEALKLAGLDDTPPSSPCRPGTDTEAEDTGLAKVRQEDFTDSYDVHSNPVCILDDGGSIISSRTMDAGPVHPEDLESRIKIVPSSVKCAKSGSKCAAQNFQSSEQESLTTDQHDLRVVEGPFI
ncbi:Zinc finger RING/FYVE/PHD-type protein [Dioscorea alata]|uniref:Zinc finger RING/FYVE/PHD-type protein n=1 Tax=Dioscorea alata TaxID=55571 RepID=A0ACB7UC63_DIOAL|nr:Zinc finger RING/FYVE/PHD-type protein [Dioscorea alata]